MVDGFQEDPFHWQVEGVIRDITDMVKEMEASQKAKVLSAMITQKASLAQRKLETNVFEAFQLMSEGFWGRLII